MGMQGMGIPVQGMGPPPPQLMQQYQDYVARMQAGAVSGEASSKRDLKMIFLTRLRQYHCGNTPFSFEGGSWGGAMKQQQEQQFHQMYMQWHFEQMQKMHSDQWKHYQQQVPQANFVAGVQALECRKCTQVVIHLQTAFLLDGEPWRAEWSPLPADGAASSAEGTSRIFARPSAGARRPLRVGHDLF